MAFESTSLNELTRILPGASTILRRAGIGAETPPDLTLAEAGRLHGVALDTLSRELGDLVAKVRSFDPAVGTAALVTLIVERYHAPLRRDFPALIALADRVETLHADHPECPHGLSVILTAFWADLGEHIDIEERVIFPLLVSGKPKLAEAPLRRMREDHRAQAATIEALAAVTNGFQPPADACRSWRSLCAQLERLSVEMQDHARLEDEVLFRAFS